MKSFAAARIDREREAEFISGERAVSPQNRTHFLNTNGGSPQGFFDGYAKKCKKSIRAAEADLHFLLSISV